jgi:hypothetical protein
LKAYYVLGTSEFIHLYFYKKLRLTESKKEDKRRTRRRNKQTGQAAVAHPCNPSCSGGRHQEDRGSKPAQANSL